MRILVIGGGGREHALCSMIHRSPRCDALFCLPGNAGTAELATNIAADPLDFEVVKAAIQEHEVDFTVVGPEDPLAAGIVDALEADGYRVFGPRRAAAQLEASKVFAKQLMRTQSIPTAEARVFSQLEPAKEYISSRDAGLVVKASGLARGKGVIVCPDPSDALLAIERMFVERPFGDASDEVIVEEMLIGVERSIMALIDGQTICMLDAAQDHKRLRDGDQGPNTGGMGAFSPTDPLDSDTLAAIESQILIPTLDGLLRHDIRYRGVLYVGLMLTAGGPKVLEYNCRFGDPEAQVILPRITSDFVTLLEQTVAGTLDEADLQWDSRHAVNVVAAAGGYPEQARAGDEITGLDAATSDDALIFHAGTQRPRLRPNQVVTSGGRVLSVTGLGPDRAAARSRAYAALEQIHFEGMQYRRDIGAASDEDAGA